MLTCPCCWMARVFKIETQTVGRALKAHPVQELCGTAALLKVANGHSAATALETKQPS